MSDTETKNPSENTLKVTSTKTLTLKRGVEAGVVRQSFSHGRSKAVVVEKVKRRVGPGEARPDVVPPVDRTPPARRGATAAAAAPAATPAPVPTPPPAPKPSGVVLRTLTEEERRARAHALTDARVREAEERKIAEEEARRRRERDDREKGERDAADTRKREEEDRRKHDEETKRKADEVAKKRFGGDEEAKPKPVLVGRPVLEAEEEEAPRTVRRGPGGVARAAPPPRPAPRGGAEKRRGRLTVVTALKADEVRERSDAAFRRRIQRRKGQAADDPKEKIIREVTIPETITIQELANRMAERAVDVIRLLMKQGHMAVITDVIDADTAQLIAEEMGHTVRRVAESDVEEGLFDTPDDAGNLISRPPVVTIMGHVDHGKTSLLDAIRSTEVAAGEAGGITQHIGAYQVTSPSGNKITFIDTPGHAAFTAMRARGAKVTDIVVLVVAADDGVMPQTIEAINHAKAAEVPIVVAINKIDKPGANPDQIRNKLSEHGLVSEEWGGDTIFVNVSAKTKEGVDKLLEMLALQAEVLELRANPNKAAKGHVVEARLDRARGPVSTILVEEGTLKLGDLLVAGEYSGKVRAMLGDKGQSVTEAGPSTPVEVLGVDGVPDAGELFNVVDDEKAAKSLVEHRHDQRRKKELAGSGNRVSLENILDKIKSGDVKEVKVVLKADVQGSIEAIANALTKLSTESVGVNVISSGVGGITESDVSLAKASAAVIIGFNVRPAGKAQQLAEQEGVDIKLYQVIYDAIDDVKKAMVGMLAPISREKLMGKVEVRQVFTIPKAGTIAGAFVTEGKITRKAQVRLVRDSVVIYTGRVGSLRRFKDDASEVAQGYECGVGIEGYNDVREGDIIESFEMETIAPTLENPTGERR